MGEFRGRVIFKTLCGNTAYIWPQMAPNYTEFRYKVLVIHATCPQNRLGLFVIFKSLDVCSTPKKRFTASFTLDMENRKVMEFRFPGLENLENQIKSENVMYDQICVSACEGNFIDISSWLTYGAR